MDLFPGVVGNLTDYCAGRLRWIAQRQGGRAGLPDAAAWAKRRPGLHRELMISLGLDPLPPRCDLRVTVTGSFAGPGYHAEKLAYQWLDDCWGSAHLYRPTCPTCPQELPGELPGAGALPGELPGAGVLYACGHDRSGVESYAHHGIAWARRGYACLVYETLEQSDNPGDHHVLNRGQAHHWIARQYSAAGAEVWNGIRALDLLTSQPGIDATRIGVTGISGGGAQAFLLACADARLRAAACVGGISDPLHAVPNRQVQQHCDCMYLRNSFGRDLAEFAALIAPRALLMAFARGDVYFTPGEFRELHARTRARFDRLGSGECCELLEYDGPHGYNTRHTTDAIHAWFDRHVAGEAHPAVDTLAIACDEPRPAANVLSVFNGSPPQPNRLASLPALLPSTGVLHLPDSPAQWPDVRRPVIERLGCEVLPGLDDVCRPLTMTPMGDWRQREGGHVRAWQGQLDGMTLGLHAITPAGDRHDTLLLAVGRRAQTAMTVARQTLAEAGDATVGVAAIEPRAGGPNAPAPEQQVWHNRIGCLAGMTPTMMVVQDVHHVSRWLAAQPWATGRRVVLVGVEEGAIALLHAALLMKESAVAAPAAVVLVDLPSSYEQTPHQIMGVLRVMDLPQAVALLSPTPTTLVNPGGHACNWSIAQQAHERFGSGLAQTASLAAALRRR